MKRYSPKRRIKLALAAVNREIRGHAQRGHIAASMASEGYAGGYADALCDVTLLLNGVVPDRRDYWDLPEVTR